MSTPDSESFSHFSANSKSLKKFRFQQKLRGLLVIVAIGTPLVIGLVIFRTYKKSTNPVIATTPSVTTPTVETTVPIDDTQVTPAIPDESSVDTSSSNTADSSMPTGVTTAIDSIEKTGLKGNSYVTADTSVVPAGTVVQANRTSWVAYSGTLGSVSGTISLKGTSKPGSITFQLVEGTWKATGYSIDA